MTKHLFALNTQRVIGAVGLLLPEPAVLTRHPRRAKRATVGVGT
jgi:hypothetical protein